MKTAQSIDTENYYYAQIFTDENGGFGTRITIVFAATPEKARARLNKWLDDEKVAGKRDIRLYQKNYKRDSRRLVGNGNYLE